MASLRIAAGAYFWLSSLGISLISSDPERTKLRQRSRHILERRRDRSRHGKRIGERLSRNHAGLLRLCRHIGQRVPSDDERAQPRPDAADQLGCLLSYLAKTSTQSPATLVARLPAPERLHRISVVLARRPRVVLVPLTAPLRMPLTLTPRVTARHLTVTYTWIRNE